MGVISNPDHEMFDEMPFGAADVSVLIGQLATVGHEGDQVLFCLIRLTQFIQSPVISHQSSKSKDLQLRPMTGDWMN